MKNMNQERIEQMVKTNPPQEAALRGFIKMLKQTPPAVIILWTYPHDDWQEAVERGITDFASYQEYLNRKHDIQRAAEQHRITVFDFSMTIKDYEAEMQQRGLGDITNSKDRAAATRTIGFQFFKVLAASA